MLFLQYHLELVIFVKPYIHVANNTSLINLYMVEKKIKIYKALSYFLITVVIILLYKYDPSIADNSLYPSSLFRELTGFYCPGCGATRALHELLHGNIQSALTLNPLLIIFMPYFIYFLILMYSIIR